MTKRKGREKGFREARTALEAELVRLRALAREVGTAYLANTEAEIVQLGASVGELREAVTDDGRLHEMIAAIRDLSVKPGKGRLKDLKRIDGLVDRLESMLQEME